MACLLVPAAEAVALTIAKRHADRTDTTSRSGISLHRKLTWLTTMLWGGALLLLLEHVWRGEIVAAFPFFTGGAAALWREMATTGVGMAVLVTAVWGVAVWAVEKYPQLARLAAPELHAPEPTA